MLAYNVHVLIFLQSFVLIYTVKTPVKNLRRVEYRIGSQDYLKRESQLSQYASFKTKQIFKHLNLHGQNQTKVFNTRKPFKSLLGVIVKSRLNSNLKYGNLAGNNDVPPEGSLFVADTSLPSYRQYRNPAIRRYQPKEAADIIAASQIRNSHDRLNSTSDFSSALHHIPNRTKNKFRAKTSSSKAYKQLPVDKPLSVLDSLYNRTYNISGPFLISSRERAEIKHYIKRVTKGSSTLTAKLITVLAKYSGLWSDQQTIDLSHKDFKNSVGHQDGLHKDASALIPLVRLGGKQVNIQPFVLRKPKTISNVLNAAKSSYDAISPRGVSFSGPNVPNVQTQNSGGQQEKLAAQSSTLNSWGSKQSLGSSRHSTAEIENTCGMSRSRQQKSPSSTAIDIPDPVCECFSDGKCSSDRVPDLSPQAFAHCRGPSHGLSFICCCLIRAHSLPLPDMRNMQANYMPLNYHQAPAKPHMDVHPIAIPPTDYGLSYNNPFYT